MTDSENLVIRRYQDVDGVINADLGYVHWGPDQSQGTAVSDGVAYKIRWSPDMVKQLAALPTEQVYLTTWLEDANRSISPLVGLPTSRVLMPVSHRLSWPSIDWKLEAIIKDQEENPSPFVWFDDEVGQFEYSRAKMLGGYAPVINPLYGITPEHLEGAREYIASLGS